MGLQVLFTSRAHTGGDKSCNKSSCITRDHRKIMETFNVLEGEFHRRIRQPFDIIEAKYTRAVVAWTLYRKLLAVYKAEVHRRILGVSDILEGEYTKNRQSKGDKASLRSNRDTSEAILKDKPASIRYQGDLLAHKS